MQELDPLDEDAAGTVFRDVILLALLGFVALVILMLPHVHPPQASSADNTTPGNLIVEIRWPDEIDADVDLWVLAPGDDPVGYSNRGGAYFDLLRDDLGSLRDITSVNEEMAYTRGLPAGEYIVNVHMYRNETGMWPVPVHVQVSLKGSPDADSAPIIRARVDLVREDQEKTVVRFRIDEEGRFLRDTRNSVYIRLRPTIGDRI